MKVILLIFNVLFLVGCSSGQIQSNTDHLSPYAPVNVNESGVHSVSYLDDGANFFRDARREDALKKMFEYCEGRYFLLNEQEKIVGGNQTIHQKTLDGYISTTLSSRYITFNFKCIES